MVKTHRILLALGFAVAFSVISAIALVVFAVLNVPSFDDMKKEVMVPIKLANGTKTTRRVGPAAPEWVPMSRISKHLLMAVIASEDASFYSHEGIDFHELKQSIKKDLEEKRWARGGSTITQQVIKNVYLSPEKTITRKVKEMIWARELDKKLEKREILCFYVNMAEFGPGIYGVGNAARHFFQTTPSELTARQSAYLAMLLPAPTKYYSYFRNKKLTVWASKRINQILRVMSRMHFIEDDAYQAALQESLWGEAPVGIDPNEDPGAAEDSEINDLEPPLPKIPSSGTLKSAPKGAAAPSETVAPAYPSAPPYPPAHPKEEEASPPNAGESPPAPSQEGL